MIGGERGPEVLVAGSGWHFTSGISYYTCRLANALAQVTPTRVILMRRLVPRILYPGRHRVGVPVNDLQYADPIEVFDGVDWFWGSTITRARSFIDQRPPDVLVLQWWTGAVLHSYLALAWLARRRGTRVVMEWHEVQDTGEARIPGVTRYVRAAIGGLLRMVDAHVVHSRYDADLLAQAYGLDPAAVHLIPHGPYDHVMAAAPALEEAHQRRPSSQSPFNILYFGVIRPYKGLEDLVAAFSALTDDVVAGLRLTVVGETWEGWTAPMEAIAASPHRDRISLVNRYVSDREVAGFFAAADAVVLPYRRSSSSGPLHIAMSAGLPVVVTAVGGLREAAAGYAGAAFVAPADVEALTAELMRLPGRRGLRFADPHSWDASVAAYERIFASLGARAASTAASGSSRPGATA